ncbi:MAG: amidohydrolase family protein [Caldilineaceae bacterium]|nr:amidohydrolase family protein [Caldilineaceae bacterium]
MDWILRNARIRDDADLVDIAITNGVIAAVGSTLPQRADQEWDLAGRAVIPGLIDAHTHLDKSYLAAANQSGTLMEAIEVWRRVKQNRSAAEFEWSARRALKSAIAHGVTAMRSHIDTEHRGDLVAVEALLTLREEMKDRIDLQLVALGFPGNGAEADETIESALRLGVDLIGGAPAITPDPTATVDAAFALAERFGKPIDLHIDETEDAQMRTLSTLADRTLAHGMEGQVTAGHCCSLAFMDDASAVAVIDQVARAQIHVITLPLCNLVLMGRNMRPTPRGVTRVGELLARGVNVCAASDNVQDPFNPFGSYDLLQTASLNAALNHMTGESQLYDSLSMVTTRPARLLGLPDDGIRVGAPADLVILDAERVLDAVTAPPIRLATFKRGRRIVRTEISVIGDW